MAKLKAKFSAIKILFGLIMIATVAVGYAIGRVPQSQAVENPVCGATQYTCSVGTVTNPVLDGNGNPAWSCVFSSQTVSCGVGAVVTPPPTTPPPTSPCVGVGCYTSTLPPTDTTTTPPPAGTTLPPATGCVGFGCLDSVIQPPAPAPGTPVTPACGATKNTCVPSTNQIIAGSDYCTYNASTKTNTCRWKCPGANGAILNCVKTEAVTTGQCCAYNAASGLTRGACCSQGLPSNWQEIYDSSGNVSYQWLCCNKQVSPYPEGDCSAAGGAVVAGVCTGQKVLPPPLPPTQVTCGNGIVDPGEECDGSVPNYATVKAQYCANAATTLSGGLLGMGVFGQSTSGCCDVKCQGCKIVKDELCSTAPPCKNGKPAVTSDWSISSNPSPFDKYNPYYALQVKCGECGNMDEVYFTPTYPGINGYVGIKNIINGGLATPVQLSSNFNALCKNAATTYKLTLNEIIEQDKVIGWTWNCGTAVCKAYKRAQCNGLAQEGYCINGTNYTQTFEEFNSAMLSNTSNMCYGSSYTRGKSWDGHLISAMCINNPNYNGGNPDWNQKLDYNWQCVGKGKWNGVQGQAGRNQVDCSSGWEGVSNCSDRNMALAFSLFGNGYQTYGQTCNQAFNDLWNNKEYETHPEKFCPDGGPEVDLALGTNSRARVENFKYSNINGLVTISWQCRGLNGKIMDPSLSCFIGCRAAQ